MKKNLKKPLSVGLLFMIVALFISSCGLTYKEDDSKIETEGPKQTINTEKVSENTVQETSLSIEKEQKTILSITELEFDIQASYKGDGEIESSIETNLPNQKMGLNVFSISQIDDYLEEFLSIDYSRLYFPIDLTERNYDLNTGDPKKQIRDFITDSQGKHSQGFVLWHNKANSHTYSEIEELKKSQFVSDMKLASELQKKQVFGKDLAVVLDYRIHPNDLGSIDIESLKLPEICEIVRYTSHSRNLKQISCKLKLSVQDGPEKDKLIQESKRKEQDNLRFYNIYKEKFLLLKKYKKDWEDYYKIHGELVGGDFTTAKGYGKRIREINNIRKEIKDLGPKLGEIGETYQLLWKYVVELSSLQSHNYEKYIQTINEYELKLNKEFDIN